MGFLQIGFLLNDLSANFYPTVSSLLALLKRPYLGQPAVDFSAEAVPREIDDIFLFMTSPPTPQDVSAAETEPAPDRPPLAISASSDGPLR